MVDFIVKIPENKTPIILQLSDPQIIDSSQALSGRLNETELAYWAKDKKEERAFTYIRETVQNTSPDLIFITGDIVYGEFDHDGSALTSFVEFMDGFGIPWAPVFGNHETESRMGADWQCAQLKNAKHCLFKQRTLTGNGNYTVGIQQGGILTRVFYMMDSNSGIPSEESIANGHSQHGAGFGEDQIAWYTQSIQTVRMAYPSVKISFAFHIPIMAFENALEKYGYVHGMPEICVDIDERGDKGADFGMIITPFYGWDQDYTVWNQFKTLGVDSIFVGHNHEICTSVVYEGIRCQFGLKSTTYDSNIYINALSKPVKSFCPGGTPVIGGTVLELAVNDGSIKNAYHYYCKNVTFEN